MAEEQSKNAVPFFPDHVRLEAKVALGFGLLCVAAGLMGLFMPVGLEDPADPLNTPAHTKPEWYFLFLYQILKFIPKTIGATAPVVALLIVAIWPFLDRKSDQSPRASRMRFLVAVMLTVVIIALTIWGEVS